MSELPSGWVVTALENICALPEQRVPRDDESFIYIDIASIDRTLKTVSEPQRLLGAEAPSRARKVVDTGDVLVSMTRPNLNAVALVHEQHSNCIASTGFDVLKPVEVEPRWVFAAVRSSQFVEAMCAKVQGALYPAVKGADIREYEIPIPPLAEQARIAQKLNELLAQVDTLKARIDTIPTLLKRFRQSVLAAAVSGRLTEEWRGSSEVLAESAEAFLERIISARRENPIVKFKEPVAPDLEKREIVVPEEWVIASVSSFAECLDSMRVPVKKELRNSGEGLYPYFGANGEVDRVDEYIFDDDLVLVTEDETFYGREKPIAYRYSGKCWVNNHVHALRAHDSVSRDYLCYSLMHYNVFPWLTGTTGRAKLTQGALLSLPIQIPPPAEQIEIVRRVEQLFTIADELEAKVASAKSRIDYLTQSILAKAFRGELVPQDPNDEPASALLERIKVQRAALPKAKRSRRASV